MAGSGDAASLLRSPWLLGIGAALVGVLLALTLGGLGLFGAPTGAQGSPTPSLASAAPSASLVAGASDAPSFGASPPPVSTLGPVDPPTAAPTAPPTVAPTPKPTRTPRPSPTPNINPTILEFKVPKTFDCTGEPGSTLHISWTIVNATGVTLSIDGGGLYASYPGVSGSDNVPFGCDPNTRTHTYTLRTTGGSGGPADEANREVKWGAQKIVSFEMGNGVAKCASDSGQVGIDLSYVIKFATGAILERDDQVYANYSGKSVDTTGIAYDCTKPEQEFRLTTSGGYGEPDSMRIVVTRRLP